MATAAILERNIRDEVYLNPMQVQAFADDIELAANNLSVIKSMIGVAGSKMDDAGLRVKHEQCAVFYGRRSGNNRPFSYSEKESQSNDTLLHFVEFSNVHNSDRSSNATRSNLVYKNV